MDRKSAATSATQWSPIFIRREFIAAIGTGALATTAGCAQSGEGSGQTEAETEAESGGGGQPGWPAKP